MGTEYELYKDDHFGELTINEMSNKLTLCFDVRYDSEEITPKEMAKIFLKGLNVCSYWMDTDELKALIQAHIDKEIY